MPTILIAVFLSVTGLLGTFLYLSQSKGTDAQIVAQQAEQRCQQARFDARFDTALSASSPQASVDADRVKTECAAAERAREHATAVSQEQSSALNKLEQAISSALSGDSK